jgi:hypothetical protein
MLVFGLLKSFFYAHLKYLKMEFNLLMHHIEIFPHHTKKKKKQILIREA